MSDSERTQEFDNAPTILEVAHTGRAPVIDDVDRMYRQCKSVPGIEIRWVWKGRTVERRFTLAVTYPVIQQTGWWDYEVRDDPIWSITDDREQGNNEIWKQKTCDTELVLLYCGMAESKQETREIVFDTAGGEDAEAVSAAAIATPVFAEILSGKPYIPTDGFTEIVAIHTALKNYEYSQFSGLLQVRSNHRVGEIYMDNGAAVHAVLDGDSGDDAFREIITWQSAAIDADPRRRARQASLSRPLDTLVAEGFGLLEQKRYLANCGLTYESYLTRGARDLDSLMVPAGPEARRIVDHLNRRLTVFDLIRDLDLKPWQWPPCLATLIHQNVVAFSPPTTRRATSLKKFRQGPGAGMDSQVACLINPKTGIFKYQALLLFVIREFELSRIGGAPLSLIIFDIKRDGSELKTRWLTDEMADLVARKIELIKRPLDLFTHYEITEYALLLPRTPLTQAVLVARRMLQTLSTMPEGLVSICGVASIPDHGSSIESLVTTAYRAKEHGRNSNATLTVGLPEDLAETARPEMPGYFHDESEGCEYFESISYGELLARAGLVSPDQFEEADQFSQKMGTPLEVVLKMQGVKIEPSVLRAGEKIHAMVDSHEMTVIDGIKTLDLIGNHGLDLDTAMRRLGRVVNSTPLGNLLKKAGIANSDDIDRALLDSGNMGLPLGFVVTARALIPRTLLHDAIDLLRLVRYGSFNEEDAVQALRAVHEGKTSLPDYLDEKGISEGKRAYSLGELLLNAELITDSEFVTARELAFSGNKRLYDVLDEQGFTGKACLDAAQGLYRQVKIGAVDAEQAAQELGRRFKKTRPSAPAQRSSVSPPGPSFDSGAGSASGPNSASTQRSSEDSGALPAPGLPRTDTGRLLRHPDATRPPTAEVDRPRTTRGTRDLPSLDPRNVDRVELLKRCGRVDAASLDRGRRLSRLHEVPLLRILYELGVLDDVDLNLSAIAKRKIEAGEIDVRRAIEVIRLCREKALDFEAGMSKVG